jgi:hypothetical protein
MMPLHPRIGLSGVGDPWRVARATGLEPATSGVTGRHSNQLSYARAARSHEPCSFQPPSLREGSGADDGARTRDLRRDRPAL